LVAGVVALLGGAEEVGVGPQGDDGAGVAELVCDEYGVAALRDQEAGEGVAECVRRGVRESAVSVSDANARPALRALMGVPERVANTGSLGRLWTVARRWRRSTVASASMTTPSRRPPVVVTRTRLPSPLS
jgi:hypothetical protein